MPITGWNFFYLNNVGYISYLLSKLIYFYEIGYLTKLVNFYYEKFKFQNTQNFAVWDGFLGLFFFI